MVALIASGKSFQWGKNKQKEVDPLVRIGQGPAGTHYSDGEGELAELSTKGRGTHYGGGLGLSPLPDADKRLRSYEIGPFTVGGGFGILSNE